MKKILFSVGITLFFLFLFFTPVMAIDESTDNPAPSYYTRDIPTFSATSTDQEVVKIEGIEPNTTRTIMIPSVRKLFSSFIKHNLFLRDLATPENSQLAIFYTENGEGDYQPLEQFYLYNGETNRLKKMKINVWYLPNRGPLVVSPDERRAVWFAESGVGYARTLHLFDLVHDTHRIIKVLPVGQSFDYGDAINLTYRHAVEWFDNCTIGYKTYNQNKKKSVGINSDEAETKLFLRSGIIKLNGNNICE